MDNSSMEAAVAEYVALRAYETNEMNLERRRVFFLVLNRTGHIDEAITLANINVNIKYLHCRYKQDLVDKLNRHLAAQWQYSELFYSIKKGRFLMMGRGVRFGVWCAYSFD